MTDMGSTREWKLFPLGANELGVKRRYSVTFEFGEGTLSCGGHTRKKL